MRQTQPGRIRIAGCLCGADLVRKQEATWRNPTWSDSNPSSSSTVWPKISPFDSVISARHVFTPADLDAMESMGRQQFGPQDNEAYTACRQPIDSFYWLSANNSGFHFGVTPEPKKELCTLEPRAYEPAEDQLRGAWGDVGDRYSDCLMVSIQFPRPGYANVYISHGPSAGFATIAQFSEVRIDRATPKPDFQRNVFDDNCPARSVHPDCPECLRFANLPAEMWITPHLLLLGMQPGSHFGTRPPFPIKLDTDRINLPRARQNMGATRGCALPKDAATVTAKADVGLAERMLARDRMAPVRLNSQWNAAVTNTGHIRLWPNGTAPTHVRNAVIGLDEGVVGWLPLPPELGISWILHCSPEFRLATYQEIQGDHGCIGRLRYTRYNTDGVIIADLTLSRLPAPIG